MFFLVGSEQDTERFLLEDRWKATAIAKFPHSWRVMSGLFVTQAQPFNCSRCHVADPKMKLKPKRDQSHAYYSELKAIGQDRARLGSSCFEDVFSMRAFDKQFHFEAAHTSRPSRKDVP